MLPDLILWQHHIKSLPECIILILLLCCYLILSCGSPISRRYFNVLSWGNMLLCRCLILSFGSPISAHCLNVLSWGNMLLCHCLISFEENNILSRYRNVLSWGNMLPDLILRKQSIKSLLQCNILRQHAVMPLSLLEATRYVLVSVLSSCVNTILSGRSTYYLRQVINLKQWHDLGLLFNLIWTFVASFRICWYIWHMLEDTLSLEVA